MTTYSSKKLSPDQLYSLTPKKLYKYRSINEFFFKMLETNSLWFSNPFDFNDPFDCRLYVKMGKDKETIERNLGAESPLVTSDVIQGRDIMQDMLSNVDWYNDFINSVVLHINSSKIGVCCLAEEYNNILMWSHYGACHKGVCIELKIERNDFFYNNMLPVQYKQRYPRFDLSNFNKEQYSMYTMYQHSICTKSIHWEYEREWRIISDDGPGNYSFSKKNLSKIIFGALATDEDIEKVRAYVKQLEYPNVGFYKCELFKKTYGLKIKKIKD